MNKYDEILEQEKQRQQQIRERAFILFMLAHLSPVLVPLVLFFTFGPMIFFAYLFSLWLL